MKKLLSISLIVMVSLIAFSFTTAKKTINESVAEKSITKEKPTELTAEEEALYCDVTIGSNHATCWFCSCSDLAKTLQ